MVRWWHSLWKRVAWKPWCDISPPWAYPPPAPHWPTFVIRYIFPYLNPILCPLSTVSAEVCEVEFDGVIWWHSDDVITPNSVGIRFGEIGWHQNPAPSPPVPHQSCRQKIFHQRIKISLTPRKSPANVIIGSISLEFNGDHVCVAQNFLSFPTIPFLWIIEIVVRTRNSIYMSRTPLPKLAPILWVGHEGNQNQLKGLLSVLPNHWDSRKQFYISEGHFWNSCPIFGDIFPKSWVTE